MRWEDSQYSSPGTPARVVQYEGTLILNLKLSKVTFSLHVRLLENKRGVIVLNAHFFGPMEIKLLNSCNIYLFFLSYEWLIYCHIRTWRWVPNHWRTLLNDSDHIRQKIAELVAIGSCLKLLCPRWGLRHSLVEPETLPVVVGSGTRVEAPIAPNFNDFSWTQSKTNWPNWGQWRPRPRRSPSLGSCWQSLMPMVICGGLSQGPAAPDSFVRKKTFEGQDDISI